MTRRVLADVEIQRILALVPWIVAHPGARKDDVAARFGITRAQLERDLRLVLMVGVPPYSPAEYIDVDDDGDTVTIRLADYFRRPLRLTPSEGLALLAAGRALLAVPGSDPAGPLATALARLEAALELPGDGAGIVVDVGEPRFLAAVRAAAGARERVEIDYWAAGRDEHTTRRVDPTAVFFSGGEWYVAGHCHRAGAERVFRVDRIRAARPTGEHFDPPGDPGPAPGDGAVYSPRPGDPRVVLDLPGGAAWVAERYPALEVADLPGGRLRVVLAVSEAAWLERLLLRVGPGARVVEPEHLRELAARASRRVRARYAGNTRD